MKKNKMTKQEAENYLLELWEDGEVPSNFTEDHSEHWRAVEQAMELGHIIWEDFF